MNTWNLKSLSAMKRFTCITYKTCLNNMICKTVQLWMLYIITFI